MKIKRILLITIVILFVSCCIYYFVVRETHQNQPPPWYVLTTPLERSVVDDLCAKLNITESEQQKLCSNEEVYADEFVEVIRRTFPLGSSYETIQEKCAVYQSRFVSSEDGVYLYVYYDFRGDEVIEIAAYFTNNKLTSIGSTQNYDDWYPGRLLQLTREALTKQSVTPTPD
ncbi:MAG: hypothetical protein CVU39_22655 [Chloroflexi bacterium HGW-Chloroflexi-10]|nr:MAG: hypothetical protein CVU39_22655 [Chloroflexi bacterium HGW-Chloroflexi-10]